jgi:hypothetical protein
MYIKDFNKVYGYDFEETENKYLVGDIESYLDCNNEWVFKFGGIYDGVDLYEFDTIESMWSWLAHEDSIIYFHNLDFDMLFFFRYWKDNNPKRMEDLNLIQSGGVSLGFRVGKVNFRNSLSIFPMSLKHVVIKFLKVNDALWFHDKANVLDLKEDELKKYCWLDCIYLYQALFKIWGYFYNKFRFDLKLTLPATALHVWKNFYLNDKDFLLRKYRHKFFDENYYYGGHTEKFIAGQNIFRNVHYYDVNSLYPYIMRDMDYINGKIVRVKPTMDKLKELFYSGILFYCEIVLNVDSERLRMFPTFDKKLKRNKYLFGHIKIKVSEIGINFITTWGSWDNIISVSQILIGEKGQVIKPFFDYVTDFYALRKSDISNDLVYKLMLNSLYGKFGQKIEVEKMVINCTYDDEQREKLSRCVMVQDGLFLSVFKEKRFLSKKTHFRMDISGKVTEGSRLYMGNLINRHRVEHGDKSVIYTDTDSIICYGEFDSALLNESKLGYLSDEIGYKDNVILMGVKLYHFYKSKKQASKGLGKVDLQDYRRLVRGGRSFMNTRFSKFSKLVNKGFFGLYNAPHVIKEITERLD